MVAVNRGLFIVLVSGGLAAIVIVLNSQGIKGPYFHLLQPPQTTVIKIGNSSTEFETIIHRQTASDSNEYKDQTVKTDIKNETVIHRQTTSDSNEYKDQTVKTDVKNETIIHRQTTSDSKLNKYKDQTNLQLPIRAITLPYKEIMTKKWYKELRIFLSVRNDPVVLLTSSSRVFLPILLNWLAAYRLATGSDLSEVLVVSTDDLTAHNAIIDKGLNSIFIKNDVDMFKIKPQTRSDSVWMKRITVARIINHLGYDVLIIDLDAIYLKDFTPIIKKYNTSDIVGSMSKWPYELNSLWGFTMCMGVAYFRSSPGTETFWNAVSNLKHNTKHMQDDQIRINYGFKALHINWIQNQTCTAHRKRNQCLVKGETAVNLSVTIVPHGVVCRHEHCFIKDVDTYYIWHVKESSGLKVHFPSGPAWFLDKNWEAAYTKHHRPREIYKLIDEVTNITKIKLN